MFVQAVKSLPHLTMDIRKCIISLKFPIKSGGISIIKKLLLILLRLLAIPYAYAVLMITLIYRMPTGEHNIKPPFWEIAELIKGDRQLLFDIIANSIMLFPLGIFLPLCFRKLNTPKKVTLTAFAVSCCIEVIQLITTRGYFETDDIFHNTLGALLGAFIGCSIARWIFSEKKTSDK